jgi:MFS family permease
MYIRTLALRSPTVTDFVRLRRARLGVFGTFFLLGFTLAAWATNLPTIQQRTGASTAAIGVVILVMGLGTLSGAQLCGHLVDRIGGQTTSLLGIVVLLAAINCFPLAHNVWVLGAIALFQGFGSGCTDVAMNNQAVIVERGYERPIMSTFHALFSVGGAIGAGFAAVLQATHISYPLILACFTLVCVIVGAFCLPAMLPGRPPATHAEQHVAAGGVLPRIGGRIALLGTLAFLLMLSEGVASNWGALHAVHQLHVTDDAASLAYGVFSTCMTIGRFLVDRVVAKIGPAAMVRGGGAIAAVGMLVVIVSHAYPLTLLGWAVYGIGLAGGVPQVFTAAGNLPSAKPGAAMARVFGFGYAGELGGPAIIGGVSALVGIGLAFFIPFAFCLTSIALAFGIRPRALLPGHGATTTPVTEGGLG